MGPRGQPWSLAQDRRGPATLGPGVGCEAAGFDPSPPRPDEGQERAGFWAPADPALKAGTTPRLGEALGQPRSFPSFSFSVRLS